MATTLHTLIEARKLIADPKRWTTRALSRDADGNGLLAPRDPRSVSFCAIGALLYVGAPSLAWDVLTNAIPREARTRIAPIPHYNNTSDHPTVIAWFDRAIESERAKERQHIIDGLKDAASVPLQSCEHDRERIAEPA